MIGDDWKPRLRAAIDEDERSEAAICEASGLSRNYIGSIYRDNRDPTLFKLLSLCDALKVSPAYIIAGVNASPETISLMAVLERNPEKRSALAALLEKA